MHSDPAANHAAPDDRTQSRALIAIVAVNFVSLAGFGLMFPVFAEHGREIGASGGQIAWAVAIFSLGQFIASSVWGRVSDRYGRRRVLISSLLLSAMVYAAHILADTPETLLLARFASGLVTGSMSIAFAVASDISTPQTRTRVMGIVGSGFSLGFIFGPAIGGFAASLAPQGQGFALVCIVGASLTLLAAAISAWALPETRPAGGHGAAAGDPPPSVLAMPDLRWPIVIGLLTSAAFAQLESVLTLFADDVLKMKPVAIGLMFAAMGTVTTMTQLFVTGHVVRRLGETVMLQLAVVVLAAGFILLGSATSLAMTLGGLFFTSTGLALIGPALSTLTSLAAPANAQGTAQGAQQAASALGRVIGPAVAGVLYEMQGASLAFYWGGAILLGTFVMTLFAGLSRLQPQRS